jgi:hypothetical protein
MNRDDAIREWYKLKQELDATQERMEELAAFLLPLVEVGGVLQARTGETLVKRDRALLDPDKLEAAVPVAMWRQITKRVPVAAHIKSMIKRGKLDSKLVDSCHGRTKPWLAIK